jgi:hypothetical protein
MPMKLSIINESVKNDVSKVFQLLRRAGIDVTSPAVRKIIKSLQVSHGQAGGGGNEIESLANGTRLVAWIKEPLPGYGSIRRGRDYLVFRPENRDVAELLASVPNGSPVSDLLNGLAFGYGTSNVLPWQARRAIGNKVSDWLSSIGFDPENVLHHGDLAIVNGDTPDLQRLRHVLHRVGVQPAALPRGVEP